MNILRNFMKLDSEKKISSLYSGMEESAFLILLGGLYVNNTGNNHKEKIEKENKQSDYQIQNLLWVE